MALAIDILQSSVIARPRVEIERGMRPLLEIVANIAHRSHLDPIAANRTIRCECGFKSPAAIPAWAVHQERKLLDIALIIILSDTNVCTYILANARLHACYLTGRTTSVVYMDVCCIVVKTIFE